jgi:hypothetical protein
MSRLDMDDRAWSDAIERYARRAGKKPSRRKGVRTGHVVAAAAVLAVLMSPWAVAKTGDVLREGKRNPTSGSSTRETEIISKSKTYGTRQSNVRDGNGGGAIYGCRASTGREPCIRANNLKSGRAFEFETEGTEAGRIEASGSNARPFTTNATGVATGLNSDKVDGIDGGKLTFYAPVGTALTEVFNFGGLVLRASCGAGPDLEVQADSTIPNALIQTSFIQGGGATDTPVHRQDNDFDAGSNFDVLAAADDSVQGTIAYAAPNSNVVTITFVAEEGNGFGGATPCVFTGTAQAFVS